MYREALDRLQPGDVLAQSVLDETGAALLRAGTALTPAYVEALRRRGVLSVYVRDGLADDVPPDNIVSEQVRATLTGHLASTFAHVTAVATDRAVGAGGVDAAVDALGEQPLPLDAADDVQQLYEDVEQLIAEILETSTVAGLESLKTHSEYTFQHSVDVAVVGALLGRRLGLPPHRLQELALGCLLHDIGKTYIDHAILDKPGALTPEEFEAVKEHPRMGFELVRRLPCRSILPAHVAYQHHERQRGTGYPRGLVGDNRIGARTAHERIGAGRMLLIAEIGAVADVYSALASDRPYRAALPPDRVMDTIAGMAGSHLNAEVVRELHRLVPRYPVGGWVEVTEGTFAGWRGVVTRVHPRAVSNPTVRLLLDPTGQQAPAPSEVDTRDQPDLRLTCLPPATAPIAVPVAGRA